MATLSDEQLAARAQQGCIASFEELVRRFQCSLLNFLRQRGAGADAEDLLQETFVRAYTNLHRYRGRYRFAAWLFTIARRLSINHYHRTSAMPAMQTGGLAEVDSLTASDRPPDELMAASEDRQQLWQLAARLLSEEEVTALWLYYVEELSAREVGKVLDRSWLATKSLLSRARKKLLPRLTHFHDGVRRSSIAEHVTSTEPARSR